MQATLGGESFAARAGRALTAAGRRLSRGAGFVRTWLADRFAYQNRDATWRVLRTISLVLGVLIPLYYVVGMALTHRIDDDVLFQPADGTEGSRAVAMAAALMEREVAVHGWVANDPFFKPCSFCDNMANYQRGMAAAIARFTAGVTEVMVRRHGGGEADPDLGQARLFETPPDLWVWNPSRSLWPGAPSERAYLTAVQGLERYNERIGGGGAIFDRQIAPLAEIMRHLAGHLGASTDALFRMATEQPGGLLFDWTSDDLFYDSKGRAYAHYMVLRALKADIRATLAQADLLQAYDRMLESLAFSLDIDPLVVVNARPGSQLLPNHLASQGFYLSRAHRQLIGLADALEGGPGNGP